MQEPRNPRKVAALAILGCFALVGLLLCVSSYLEERHIRSEIADEEAALLKLGIDLREPSPKEDACNVYRTAFGNWPLETTLEKLERATRLPMSGAKDSTLMIGGHATSDTVLHLLIDDQLWALANTRIPRDDVRSLERAFDIHLALQRQAIASLRMLPSNHTGLEEADETFVRVIRRKLMTLDQRPFVMAALAGYIRKSRTPHEVVMPAATSPDALHRLLHACRDAILHTALRSDLKLLRAFREGVLACGSFHQRYGFARFVADTLRPRLRAAKLPDLGASAGTWFGNEFDIPRPNLDLIVMDLRESRQKGKPLVLTWSRPYCFDDFTGERVTVTATKDLVTLLTKYGSVSSSY